MKNLLLILLLASSLGATAQQTFTWTQIADYPYKAWGMNSCGHNGLLYSFSNCGGGNNTLYSYDAATNKWDTLAKLSGSIICNTSLIGVGDKLYLATAGSIKIYDIPTDTWEAAGINTPAGFNKDGATTVAVGTDIYYIGGGSTKNLHKLNTTTKTFAQLANMNTGRENTQAVHLNNKLYVFGGRLSGSALNTIEVYDIANDTWSNITSTIDKRYFGFAVTDGFYIYLLGGERGVNNYKYKSIELYNPTTQAVTQLASTNDMNVEHTAHAFGLADNKLIAAAGFTSTPTNAITEYSEATNFSNTVSIIKNTADDLSFTIYPNPSTIYVNVEVSKAVETVNIYTMDGKEISSHATNNRKSMSIDVSKLSEGMYLIRSIGKQGAQTQLLRITQ